MCLLSRGRIYVYGRRGRRRRRHHESLSFLFKFAFKYKLERCDDINNKFISNVNRVYNLQNISLDKHRSKRKKKCFFWCLLHTLFVLYFHSSHSQSLFLNMSFSQNVFIRHVFFAIFWNCVRFFVDFVRFNFANCWWFFCVFPIFKIKLLLQCILFVSMGEPPLSSVWRKIVWFKIDFLFEKIR